MKKLFYQIIGGAYLLAPALALAQGGITNEPIPVFRSRVLGGGEQAIVNLLTKAANIVAFVVLAVAVIMILASAFNFITAGGDEEKLKTARRQLIYALVGIAVALLAFTLPTTIGNLIQS
ncbi:MAG: hypothetical protein HYT39_03680 [Candidatus Sungbacteria bacterium]|nr:hypothetical protein [Candidatus Sungbacteria bacterium]